MTNAADGGANGLASQYGSLLQAYIKAPAEPLREEVSKLAHKAIAQGRGLLDMVAAHHEALLKALGRAHTMQESEEITKRASEFLLESLVPFEMTHLGYQETIQRLVAANEALARSEAELEKRVEERTADLARANEELRTEVAERKRAEAALREVNSQLTTASLRAREQEEEAQRRAVELAALNQELEAFSYSVSHDLRAPLRHIDGFSKILLEDYAAKLDERGKKYLKFLREGSQKMDQLIDAMLQLSRVTRAEMRRQLVNLSELAESILADLRKEQPKRQAEVTIAPNVIANGDPLLLRIALENLLGNAWKFTSNRPIARIEFGVKRENAKLVYFVRDNGAGFDMAYADKLFGAFQRLHRPEEFPGTGIGLATVQRIIYRHGGRIWAEGKVDKGATFYFTLQ